MTVSAAVADIVTAIGFLATSVRSHFNCVLKHFKCAKIKLLQFFLNMIIMLYYACYLNPRAVITRRL